MLGMLINMALLAICVAKTTDQRSREIARRTPSRLDESLREQDGDVAQGPWGLAASNGSPFPLRPSAISEALAESRVKSLAAGWANMHRVAAETLCRFPRHRRLCQRSAWAGAVGISACAKTLPANGFQKQFVCGAMCCSRAALVPILRRATV